MGNNVIYLNHPLLSHKITMMRDKNTPSITFRTLVKEVAVLEAYEALRGLPTKKVEVETPITKTSQPLVDGSKICFVPILRAGLGMLDGFLDLLPTARVGHIGIARDEKTHEPHEYYCRLPDDIEDMEVFLLDPMLATGGSANDAVARIKARGVKKITFVCMIAAPEGIKAFTEANPDVPLYVGALDERLNENCYIVPGLGDAGDRIFGTN